MTVLREVAAAASELDPAHPSVRMGGTTQRIVRRVSGLRDPYAELKRRSNEAALRLVPGLRERIAASPDPFEAAARVAIAGNVIDFGALSIEDVPDLERATEESLAGPLAVDHLARLRAKLASARSVLVVGDNAGECVFDRLLLEQLVPGPELTYVVRSGPVLNDALRADALIAGIDELARVVTWGCDAPGALLHTCSPATRQLFDSADVVIAKGQGNFECLEAAPRSVFFLLRVKCPVVARHVGQPEGSLVALQGGQPRCTPLRRRSSASARRPGTQLAGLHLSVLKLPRVLHAGALYGDPEERVARVVRLREVALHHGKGLPEAPLLGFVFHERRLPGQPKVSFRSIHIRQLHPRVRGHLGHLAPVCERRHVQLGALHRRDADWPHPGLGTFAGRQVGLRHGLEELQG